MIGSSSKWIDRPSRSNRQQCLTVVRNKLDYIRNYVVRWPVGSIRIYWTSRESLSHWYSIGMVALEVEDLNSPSGPTVIEKNHVFYHRTPGEEDLLLRIMPLCFNWCWFVLVAMLLLLLLFMIARWGNYRRNCVVRWPFESIKIYNDESWFSMSHWYGSAWSWRFKFAFGSNLEQNRVLSESQNENTTQRRRSSAKKSHWNRPNNKAVFLDLFLH